MRSLVWRQRVGYVDSTFLDSEQGPGEAIHTTSFSLHLAPLEFSVIRYNAGGEGKYLVQFPIDTRNTSGYLLTLIHEAPRFLVSWLRNEVDFVQTGHNFIFPLKIGEFLGLASYLVGVCCHLLLVFGLSCWVEGWAGSTARVVLSEREMEPNKARASSERNGLRNVCKVCCFF